MERTNLATLEIAGKAQIGTESEAEVTFPTYVEAVTAFGESLLAKSPRTRTNYLSALNRFREFLVSLGWQPDAIRTDIFPPEILEQFYTWLLKINGRERRSTAVAYVSELIGRLHYKTPRVDDAIALIVTTAKNHPIGPNDGRTLAQRLELLRDRAILTTLYATGMRREELSHLNRTDIQDGRVDDGLVTGKGGKERVVFFDEASLTAIRAYLAARNDTYLPLFLRHDAGRGKAGLHGERWRLSPQSIWGVVKKYSRLANVNATTHHLRHLKARVLLNNGAQLSEVQDILGHASPETTKKIYAPYTKQHLREAFDRFSLSAEDIARRARRTPDAE